MKYEIVAFYKQEIEEIRECAENIGRLYGWRYRCEKIPGSGKLLSACMGEDSVLCLLKRKSYSFYRLMKYVYALNKPVLVLQDHFSADTFQQLKIPVGYLKENKEKGFGLISCSGIIPGVGSKSSFPGKKMSILRPWSAII